MSLYHNSFNTKYGESNTKKKQISCNSYESGAFIRERVDRHSLELRNNQILIVNCPENRNKISKK